jgi:signal transduction histidine kinase
VFRVVVKGDASLPPLAGTVEIAALRVASEAICNAARHSRGTGCAISIESCADGVTLTVTDDGVGIGSEHHRGVGLESMATRTAGVGGTLSIRPGPAEGTVLAAWFPAADSIADPAPDEVTWP